MTPLDHALSLAAKGIHVFWAKGASFGEEAKKPYEGTRGFKDATTNPEVIRKGLEQWPDSYLAVRTGSASKLTMVDFDGELGESFRLSRDDWGNPRIHKTKRGHHYVYFTARRSFQCTGSTIAPKVDTRGDGGYMIWWPAHGLAVLSEKIGRMPLAVRKLFPPKIASDRALEPAPAMLSTEEFERLKESLYAIDPDCSEWEWTRAIWSVRYVTNKSQDGLDLVMAWSASARDYNPQLLMKKWNRPDRAAGKITTGIYLGWESDVRFSTVEEEDISLEVSEPPPAKTEPPKSLAVDLSLRIKMHPKTKVATANMFNLYHAVATPHYCGYSIGYDEFRAELMQVPFGGNLNDMTPFTDNHYAQIQVILESKDFANTPLEKVRQTVGMVGTVHSFDSAQLWLRRLEWDLKPRCYNFMRDYFGSPDCEYSRAVSLYLWSALAGRVMSPGCQADMAVILVGGQGVRKSTGVAALAPLPEQFVELSLDQEDDDLARQMSGCLVGELSELRGLNTRDLESIKGFITRKHEKWIPKYKEFANTYPRRLVLIGTTNKTEFLADETGERRFLPIDVTRGEPEAIRRDLELLWAEARFLYQAGGVCWREAERLAPEVTRRYKVTDSWEDSIEYWAGIGDGLDGTGAPRSERGFTTAEAATGALGYDIRNINRGIEMRLSKVLTGLGYKKNRPREGQNRARLWSK